MSKTEESMGKNELRGYVRRETMIAIAVACLFVGYLAGSLFDNVSIGGGSENSNFQIQQPAAVESQQQPVVPQQPSSIENLRQQAENDPKNARSWTVLGNTYFDAGMYEDAISAYTRSLQAAPGDPNVLTDLGIMYRRSGNPGKAVESFDQAISAAPEHVMSRFNKGIVLLYDLGDKAGTITAWEGLVRIAPQFKSPSGELITDLLQELQDQ
jgi:cytochrome c-type biogenesis protein CcmH/NrfG